MAAAWLSQVAWRRRRAPGAMPLALTAALLTVWCALAAVETISRTPSVKIFLADLEIISQSLLPALWLLAVLEFTGSRLWLRRAQPWLFVIPAVTVALVFTTGQVSNAGSFAAGVAVTFGWWFWVQAAYSGLLLAASLLLLMRAWLAAAAPQRSQLAMLLACMLLPLAWVASLGAALSGGAAPLALALCVLILVGGLFSVHLFDPAPLAQAAVVAGLHEAVVVIDLDGRIADFNPAAARLFGWSFPDQPAGRGLRGQQAAQALAAWPDLAEKLAEAQDAAVQPAELARGLGADRRVFELGRAPLLDVYGRRAGLVLSLSDATEHHRIEDELARLATTDELTGLADRHRAFEALSDEVRLPPRYESNLALLLMDLDQFKSLNQAIGRQAGDEALQAVARAIQRLARQSDLPARPGSDEFIIILPHTTLLGAETVAGRLLAAVSQIQAGPRPAQPAGAPAVAGPMLKLSIGAAELAPGDDDQGEALLARAERALRAAKAAGGARVMVMEETPLISPR